mmetsp:Transcript_167653/g.538497  ORF Transcript_167653/g.538497 Transcript_167653/m.538497 type:complete len:358 (-) Transcript_167653:427-1500(-)
MATATPPSRRTLGRHRASPRGRIQSRILRTRDLPANSRSPPLGFFSSCSTRPPCCASLQAEDCSSAVHSPGEPGSQLLCLARPLQSRQHPRPLPAARLRLQLVEVAVPSGTALWASPAPSLRSRCLRWRCRSAPGPPRCSARGRRLGHGASPARAADARRATWTASCAARRVPAGAWAPPRWAPRRQPHQMRPPGRCQRRFRCQMPPRASVAMSLLDRRHVVPRPPEFPLSPPDSPAPTCAPLAQRLWRPRRCLSRPPPGTGLVPAPSRWPPLPQPWRPRPKRQRRGRLRRGEFAPPCGTSATAMPRSQLRARRCHPQPSAPSRRRRSAPRRRRRRSRRRCRRIGPGLQSCLRHRQL